LLLVHRGLENTMKLIGLKPTLYIQLYATAAPLVEDTKVKSMKLFEATGPFSLKKRLGK